MTEEERRNYFYWKEIDERDGNLQPYDADEGVLIGVDPLSVAEIFSLQGYKIKMYQLDDGELTNDEDSAADRSEQEIELNELEHCSVGLHYQVVVSWAVERAKGKQK